MCFQDDPSLFLSVDHLDGGIADHLDLPATGIAGVAPSQSPWHDSMMPPIDYAALDLAMASQELLDTGAVKAAQAVREECRDKLQAATTSLRQVATNARPSEEVEQARLALLAVAAQAGLQQALESLHVKDGNANRRTRLQTMHRILPRL